MSLQKGSKGEDVKAVQDRLKVLGLYDGPIDGDFGKGTKRAVVEFQSTYLVDGIVDGGTLQALDRAVAAWTERDQVILFPVPVGLAELEKTFGKIVFDEAEAGNVVIVNDWHEENIVRADLPVVGRQLVHKLMVPVFEAVLTDIDAKGLADEIEQFGCYCPRHKMHDPRRGLSTHSWAIAGDLNWATNPVGKVGDLPQGIIDSFERHGFNWGGRWSTRDDMHFQYCRNY